MKIPGKYTAFVLFLLLSWIKAGMNFPMPKPEYEMKNKNAVRDPGFLLNITGC